MDKQNELSNFKDLGAGDIGIVRLEENGDIRQIGLTEEQRVLFNLFLGSLSKEKPFILLPEHFNLKLVEL